MTKEQAQELKDKILALGKNKLPTEFCKAKKISVNPFSEKPKKKSKYHNVKTVVDGITFDSKAEAKRYGELKLMEKAGVITTPELQKKYPIVINGIHICNYIADFVYINTEGRKLKLIVEDTKGMRTPVYNLKKKLMKAVHNIDVVEIYSDKKSKKIIPLEKFKVNEKDLIF